MSSKTPVLPHAVPLTLPKPSKTPSPNGKPAKQPRGPEKRTAKKKA